MKSCLKVCFTFIEDYLCFDGLLMNILLCPVVWHYDIIFPSIRLQKQCFSSLVQIFVIFDMYQIITLKSSFTLRYKVLIVYVHNVLNLQMRKNWCILKWHLSHRRYFGTRIVAHCSPVRSCMIIIYIINVHDEL